MPGSARSEQATIEVRVRDIGQLFNSFDPSPFHERDLDDDAEQYLVGWAREVDKGGPFLIVIHLPQSEAVKAEERGLATSLANYFDYRSGMLKRNLRDLMRTGRRSSAIGIAVLCLCVLAGQLVRQVIANSSMAQAIAEGLIVFGWVANWRPAEIFLYDIWTARRRIDLYRRLAKAEVELRSFG